MEVLTYTGHRVEKPECIKHQPRITKTVKPKERITFSEWFEHVRNRKDDKVETVNVFYL